ncbi:homoserine dehydrogenase [Noviherbaspirillum cavernae]|uniref:Homoserine dehydrogenase n=1 Tax=Noviherbaspirillum cavernae TaxID=2320862 RepID=A0A418X239_9BURK|nr:homoserine dehydrogenase [Noviherbaspirillum cavernae]RJG06519.1 homoserine dehydrogenase [Noviherbaspirillum cavernae]
MKIGVLGFGNVAAATVQRFVFNRDLIASKLETEIEIAKVATRTVSRASGLVPQACVLTDDCWSVVDDPEIDVVIELIGGVELAKELVLRAIANGKHVITANKALLATSGEKILQLADQKGVCVLFEGAVAVSIPIIKTLKESAAANRVSSIVGILNGTSNYILSQMSEQGADFGDALAQAQQKGYAEADPALDVNGEDAAHKITILASLAFGVPVDFDMVRFKGITEIERADIQAAKRLGYELKLIAQAQLRNDKVSISVAPTLVPNHSMLAHVRGSMNGISLAGDLFGPAFFYGSGAGGVQTASAILADLIDLAQSTRDGKYVGAPNMGFKKSAMAGKEYLSSDECSSQFYLRLKVEDKVGVLAEVSAIFAKADVSVSTLLQDESREGMTDLIATTHAISTSKLQSILPLLQDAAGGHPVVTYPVLDERAD